MEEGNKTLTADELVDLYGDLLLRIAVQHTGNIQEAEDIVQEAFFAMLRKSPFDDAEYAKRWLIRVTINKCKDYFKSSRRKNLPLLEGVAATTEIRTATIEEIENLDPVDRNIIYLFYYEGYSAKEIAKMIGKTRNAVNIRLSRARETLRGLIEGGDSND